MKAISSLSASVGRCCSNIGSAISSGCNHIKISCRKLKRRKRIQSLSIPATEQSFRKRTKSSSYSDFESMRADAAQEKKSSIIGKVLDGAKSIRRASVELKKQDETYAEKALRTPANFLNWLFRFCFVTGFAIFGVFVGQQIGCAIERGDKCNEDPILLMQGKAKSLIPWAIGILFSAIASLVSKKLWSCFAIKIESKLDKCQTWAKARKSRVITFLSSFYSLMILITGAIGLVVEKYGEEKIWPKKYNSSQIGIVVGVSLGFIVSLCFLLKPLIKCHLSKRFKCCMWFYNKLCNCITEIGAAFTRTIAPERTGVETNDEEGREASSSGVWPMRREERKLSDEEAVVMESHDPLVMDETLSTPVPFRELVGRHLSQSENARELGRSSARVAMDPIPSRQMLHGSQEEKGTYWQRTVSGNRTGAALVHNAAAGTDAAMIHNAAPGIGAGRM